MRQEKTSAISEQGEAHKLLQQIPQHFSSNELSDHGVSPIKEFIVVDVSNLVVSLVNGY